MLLGLLQSSVDGTAAGTGFRLLDWLVVALLLALAGLVFRRRHDTRPPKWMGRLQTATPGFSFRLGLLLFLLMPTDTLTMLSVGARLARHGAPFWQSAPFLSLTIFLAATPALVVLLLGRWAQARLPAIRDWMNAHSWIISEVVIVFFLAVTIAGR